MRILMNWNRDFDGRGFMEFVDNLEIEYCAYFGDAEDPNVENKWCVMEKIPIYNSTLYDGLNFCRNRGHECEPLDLDLINKMKHYESVALEILYRWRRSITDDFSITNLKGIYYEYLKFWSHFLKEKEIDCVVFANIPHIPTLYVCYALCKALGISVFARVGMPIVEGWPEAKYLTTDIENVGFDFYNKLKENEKYYKNYSAEEIGLMPILDSYFDNYDIEGFGRKSVVIVQDPLNLVTRAQKYARRGILYLRKNKSGQLLRKMAYHGKKVFISRKILKYCEKVEGIPDLKRKFIYFPLHYQPEASTLPHAGVFSSQLLIIDIIASNLPDDVFLYVKEHPAYWTLNNRTDCVSESRSYNYYRYILSKKNVVLIQHDFDSFKLLDYCLCVVTANGTIGWEALFKGKSVLAFGNYFYNYHRDVYKITNGDDFNKAIKKIMAEANNCNYEKDLRILLKTLEDIIIVSGFGDSEIPEKDWSKLSNEDFSCYQARVLAHFIKSVIDA